MKGRGETGRRDRAGDEAERAAPAEEPGTRSGRGRRSGGPDRAVSVLHERTLVLNRNWAAIATTTVRTALVLLCRESARVICPETYQVFDLEGWIGRSMSAQTRAAFIRTPRYHIEKPEVILLRDYSGRVRREVTFSRKNLYRRDNYTCQYCGEHKSSEDLSIDHVIPKSRGGKTTWDNCVLACIRCNAKKANRSLSETGFVLVARPEKPRWSPFEDVNRRERPTSWEKFIADEYWNTELQD